MKREVKWVLCSVLKHIIVVMCVLLFHTAEATSYYVDSQSLAPNELGTLLYPWTTIDQAASYPLLPGDIVYIKAGNYGSESVCFFSSGIAGSPIIFQGYLLTLGDEPVASEPRFTLHSTEMPTLNGMNPSTGIALDLLDMNRFQNERSTSFKINSEFNSFSRLLSIECKDN